MKKIMLSVCALGWLTAFAQEQTSNEAPVVEQAPQVESPWKRSGTISLLFNQAAFNHDWTGGGTNNYGGNLNLSYDANYKKDVWAWDNKLVVDYGLTRVDGDDFSKKTNDRFVINSLLGRQLSETWYFSFFANFQTQLDKGYTYGTDNQGRQTRTETTHFLAPGYFSFGPGMLWKKSDNLKVNIAPATSRLIFTDKKFTETAAHFGIEKGKTSRFEFGAAVNGYAKFDVLPNITVENTLNLYSNYLDKPANVDIDYTLNLLMKVNNYISANFIFQAIYDDDAAKAFQIREAFGAGLTYKF
ncbi:DUF3078 domain-containing protein [uncultured Capnocytophaga sp.]|uniref:DUF3078 domain-containing protein n=1 Tax=uncultured Capnocytophaga sp. TaxID=159273 RepID=UPI002623D327|nr:DUF3078 domain-containing protein [uncultured Capnocytophaga sp.]